MSAFLPTLINELLLYGYPVLWISIFVASVGVPLPISLVLLAAGAFAALGDFNVILLAVISISASVCGDNAGYFIGRRWGWRVLIWLEQPRWHRFVSPRSIEHSRMYFKRRGGWAIFLSRFLFSALGGIINLLSGTNLYPYRRFLLYDVAGEIVNALLPLSLGYIFGASWEAIGDIFGAVSGLALALLAVIFLVSRLIRMIQRGRTSASRQEVSTLKTALDAYIKTPESWK